MSRQSLVYGILPALVVARVLGFAQVKIKGKTIVFFYIYSGLVLTIFLTSIAFTLNLICKYEVIYFRKITDLLHSLSWSALICYLIVHMHLNNGYMYLYKKFEKFDRKFDSVKFALSYQTINKEARFAFIIRVAITIVNIIVQTILLDQNINVPSVIRFTVFYIITTMQGSNCFINFLTTYYIGEIKRRISVLNERLETYTSAKFTLPGLGQLTQIQQHIFLLTEEFNGIFGQSLVFRFATNFIGMTVGLYYTCITIAAKETNSWTSLGRSLHEFLYNFFECAYTCFLCEGSINEVSNNSV